MKAIIYKIWIVDGILDLSHGFKHGIDEIFIPEKGIGFNLYRGINTFKSPDRLVDADTSNITEIEIPDEMVEQLESYLNLKEEIESKVENLFECVTK